MNHVSTAVIGISSLCQVLNTFWRTGGDFVRFVPGRSSRNTLMQTLLAEEIVVAQAGPLKYPMIGINDAIWRRGHYPMIGECNP